MYVAIGRSLPKGYRNRLRQQLLYAGLKATAVDRLAGFFVLFSIAVGATAGFVTWTAGLTFWAPFIGIFAGATVILSMHTYLLLAADARAKQIELVLPDCLQLMSANIKSGMTIDKALWLSAKPEFGVLEEEIRMVATKTLSGESLLTSLHGMTERNRSQILDKSVRLLIQGIEGGGELAKLLDETAANIRTTQMMRKEVKSGVLMYSIFIVFAAVIGAPLLFGISLYFIEMMEKLWGAVDLPESVTTTGFLKLSAPQFTSSEMFQFAIACIAITTIFGGLLIGLIQHGTERQGLRYIPVLTAAALAVFFVAKTMLSLVFGGLIAI